MQSADYPTTRRVCFLQYIGEWHGCEATGEPQQCPADAALDQSNFAVDETTNETVF